MHFGFSFDVPALSHFGMSVVPLYCAYTWHHIYLMVVEKSEDIHSLLPLKNDLS
jgi:hypothetical protein